MSFSRKPKRIDPDEVDPDVYYYDEVYDEMKDEEKSEKSRTHRATTSGSKYVQGLQEAADLRKTEKELRKFKRHARDREEARADSEFADKEVYVTSGYRKKLTEMEMIEEERKRRLEREKDRSMNFLKSSPRIPPVSSSKSDKTQSDPIPDAPDSSKHHPSSTTKVEPRERRSPVQDDDGTATASEPTEKPISTTKRKKPVTLDERREYLREVLAKRTVGEVYDDAVQRYIERKALAH